METSINQLLSNNDSFVNEISLINKFYRDYYFNNKQVNNLELNYLLNFILVQSINNLNEKLNKNSARLLFQINDSQHQSQTCNQLLNLYEINNKKYLNKLNTKYSNRILINLNQNNDLFYYEIEQYKVENNQFYYFNKLDSLNLVTFNDLDAEFEYKFRIIVFKRGNHLKIPFKYAYFTLTRNSVYQQLNINLVEQPDINVIVKNIDTTLETINLTVFRFNYLLDLLNNFKINTISLILNLIIQIIDENQIENMINYEHNNNLNTSNDLIINITNIKMDKNVGDYYIGIKIDHFSCQSSCLATGRTEILHLKNVNFDFLLQNPEQNVVVSLYKYDLTSQLVNQNVFMLNLLDSTAYLLLDNEILSLSLKFQVTMKLNNDLLNFKSTTNDEILDNCLKQLKNDQNYEILHLKKALLLTTELLKMSNQPKKKSEQLFKLIISILSSMQNDDDYIVELNQTNNLCKFLLQNLKSAFDINETDESDFIPILRTFHLLINLVIKLMNHQEMYENLKLSFKYDLNYIFMKIGKKSYKKKFFIFSFLNFEFISSLFFNNIYSINEIYEIICLKLFNDLSFKTADDEFNSYLKLVEEIIVQRFLNTLNFTQLLTFNYEFRVKFIKFLVNSFLLNQNCRVDSTKLSLIFYLINDLSYKFDKKEFKLVFKSVLNTFELSYKFNTSFEVSEGNVFEQDFTLFLCLIDLITQSVSITSIQQLNNYFDNLKLADFIYIFQLFSFFLNSKPNSSLKLVWLHVNDVLSQYLSVIFKYILRLIAILTIETVVFEHEIEILLISYFKLDFILSQENILSDLSQISGYLGKYKHLNEFLIRSSIKMFIKKEINNDDFFKLIDYLCSYSHQNRYLVEILLIYELIDDHNELDIIVEVKIEHSICDLVELCIDYRKSKKTTIIEQKILTFKLYQIIASIKLSDFTEKILKIKFEIEYKLIKSLIKLNEANYYEIIVLYKNKLDLFNKCLSNEDRKDEIEKFYHLNLFKYLCLYELSVLTKQFSQQKDINLIKIMNKSVYNQLFQIYKHIYKFFIKNSSNFKLIEYINLKLNELNLKLNNTDENLKLVDEKLLFKNTFYYFCIGFFQNSPGSTHSKSITNRYFLYTSQTNELLSVIQNYISENFSSNVQILSLNQDPMTNPTSPILYAQIFSLKKLDKDDLVRFFDDTLVGDKLNEFKIKAENDNVKYFYYDKPYFKNFDNNNIENLWIERTIMFVSTNELVFDVVEYFNEFIEIKCLVKLFLQPIQNAINDCNDKTVELREFINGFTFNAIEYASLSNVETMSKLQPLTMRLLGCLDGKLDCISFGCNSVIY